MSGKTADFYIDVHRQVYVPAGHAAVLRARAVREIERRPDLFPPNITPKQNEERKEWLRVVAREAFSLVVLARIALAHERNDEDALYMRSVEEIGEYERSMRKAWAYYLEHTPVAPLREEVGLIA